MPHAGIGLDLLKVLHYNTFIMNKRQMQDMLRFASDRAEGQGQRWTETRAQVYAALLSAGRPATAYQLVDAVAAENDRTVNATSVYRALDALIALGLIAKVESIGAFVACTHPHDAHQHVFLVCGTCGDIDEIADHGISGLLAKDAAGKGFRAQRQVLELHGDCQGCRRT